MKPIQDGDERQTNRLEMVHTSNDERELLLIFHLARQLDSPERLWSELASFWRRVAEPADPLRQSHLAGLMARWLADYRQALDEARLRKARRRRAAAYRRWSDLRAAAKDGQVQTGARSNPVGGGAEFCEDPACSVKRAKNLEQPGSPSFTEPAPPVEMAPAGAVEEWRARRRLDGLVDEACRSLSLPRVPDAPRAADQPGHRPIDRPANSPR